MTEITANAKSANGNRLSQWLFNPFRFIAGFKALLLGLVIILLSALVGSFGNTHFDGVIDFHKNLASPLWYFLVEGVIDWICMVIPLFFFGLIVSRSSFRMIDVFGTQALARWPYLITSVVMLPEANARAGAYLVSKVLLQPTIAVSYIEMLIFVLAMMVGVCMAIWMVALMYRAYAISCNIKGAGAVITFIVSLIGAEVLSKFAILSLLI